MAEFNLWLLVLGIAAGAAVTWVVIGTIARNDDEVAAEEQAAEADWIARTIEEHGGRAPTQLVAQILSLHRRYLQGGVVIPVPEPEPEADAADQPVEVEVEGETAATRPTELAGDAAEAEGTPDEGVGKPASGPRKRASRRKVRR
jgi:hypothetical protein